MTVTNQEIAWGDSEIRASRLGTVFDHGEEDDISRLVEFAEPVGEKVALDLITGLGHVARALAPHVRRVDALDPDSEMLREAENLTLEDLAKKINFIEGDPTELPFEADSYDIVVSRMALRHLGDGTKFIREAHRVLKPSGRLLMIDSLASPHPALEEFLRNLFSYYDRSHVKSYTLAELENLLEREGFDIDLIEIYPKEHDFETFSKQFGEKDDNVRMIAKMLQSASSRVKRHLRVIEKKSKLVSFITWMILIQARPASSSSS